jgi:hypothetical protein
MVPLTLCRHFFFSFLLFSPTVGDQLDYQNVFDRRFHFVQARSELFCLEDFMFIPTTVVPVALQLPYSVWSWQKDVGGNDQPPDRNCTRRLSFYTATESLIKYDHRFIFCFEGLAESRDEVIHCDIEKWPQSLAAVTRIFICTSLSIFEVATVSNWSRVRGSYPNRCITTKISPMNPPGYPTI